MSDTSDFRLVDCTEEAHAESILAILNEAILHSTAIYDYLPRPVASMKPWFETRRLNGYPIIGVESPDGELLGFASYGSFRAWAAFKYSMEHSVYVHADHRGRGFGALLLRELLARAGANGVHVLVGGIDTTNTGSIVLHESLGFVHAGTIREAGFKFGRWLDLAFYQCILDTPEQPVEP